MKKSIHLDNNAATPLDPTVAKNMSQFFSQNFANPSVLHEPGEVAQTILQNARKTIAEESLGCCAEEIFFVSSGTEANNLCLRGYAYVFPYCSTLLYIAR